MDEFRFSCGKCGQHLKAEVDCGDVVIECPLCATRIRVPKPARPGEALPVARETTALVTPPSHPDAAPVARMAAPTRTAAPPSGLEPPGEPPPTENAGKRGGSPGLLAAAVVIPLLAGAVALWLWQPWRGEQTVLPPPASPPQTSAPTTPSAPPAAAVAEPSPPPEITSTAAPPSATEEPGTPTEPGTAPPPPERSQSAAQTPDETAAFVASWEVDFSAQPRDATALIEAQLGPLGLSVSPSLYTATRGHSVNLPVRRGTRLELIELVGRQVGWKPIYAGRQLKFERGARKEPVAFAGPFMLRLIKVTPSSAFGTARLTFHVTGVGIPKPLRQRWEQALLRLTDIQALTAAGTDLYDAGAEVSYRSRSARGGPLEFEQDVGLYRAYRGVTRLAVFRAALDLPGLPPPAHRLQFELRDLPLKPGPDTPESARPLEFEGVTPVTARILSTLPGYPFYRARVEVRNLADRPLREITLQLRYFDPAGEVLGVSTYTQKGSATLPGPRQRRVLASVPLRDRPEATARVGAVVAAARFIDGTQWKRASEDKPR